MLRLNNIKLPLDHAEAELVAEVSKRLGIELADVLRCEVFKRSFDARNKNDIQLIYQVDIELAGGLEAMLLEKYANQDICRPSPDTGYRLVAEADTGFPSATQQRPIVIGFGPCGILAALLLAQMGLRPIVLERGKAVRERTADTWAFWRKGELKTESNVQYGEGGAGTFSDGKLYSQVKDKRFLGRKVQMEFVKAGAPEEILYVSKPHIGTFKLVKMVENIRAEIVRLGGEIRFSEKVDHLQFESEDTEESKQVTGVVLASGEVLHSRHVVLAIGHSARDSFQMLQDQGVYIEPKPFSIGFRIEHPQSVIDRARFGKHAGHPILGAADYKLVHHCDNGRSVYSFCMCPGGTVVAAASEEGGLVTNGMSQYSRNERNANSAIVVGISPEQDYPGDPLAGIDLQRTLERRAFKLGGSDYTAPAQLVGDFLDNKPSSELAGTQPSYKPGIKLTDLSSSLPPFAIAAIQEAIPAFDKQIKGFAMRDAMLTAVETRTSSPICIKRDKQFESINTRGLYPAGEGAGYAGGILSAGIDGIKVAEAIALSLLPPSS
ncbi:NAD(P)/FAD-dependent oxidoreductase [Halieaceae bacterium IMCC14734]|uniref:NAD(P)/FAD-dependent oxidoreductase n=1 Tax=Candidatus Litorirhabdus singularis TaxID=2518993 RepID=A0ABT3TF27_9GAMM|nr:NAD(P)/FAD-dependent oxidoreductase [Candidatus Litorirhabdus singularis]MCX2980614.1 NAD(P)/FAD-dependent oxidoreductase [Candidatus Litorirhabdus singularis]